MIYSTEKSLTDNAEKLDAATKEEVNKAVADAKKAKEGDDLDDVNAKKEALSQASMKIGQAIYGSGGEKPKEDGTVDADFEDKSQEEKKEQDHKKDDKKE